MNPLAHRQRDGIRADEKVASYLRVSTATQTENYGLSIQEEEVQKYLTAHPHLRLVKTYRDQGSGADLNRPELQNLLRDAPTLGITKVLTPRMDRIARDLYSGLFFEKQMMVHNIELVSCTESLAGSDPVTVALRRIVHVFASMERELIRVRSEAGRRKKLCEGRYAGGRPALGYKVDDGELVVDFKERDLLLLIRKMRWGRHSYRAIASKLNALGHRTKLQKLWSDKSVKYVLTNTIYKKQIRYGGEVVDGIHEPTR